MNYSLKVDATASAVRATPKTRRRRQSRRARCAHAKHLLMVLTNRRLSLYSETCGTDTLLEAQPATASRSDTGAANATTWQLLRQPGTYGAFTIVTAALGRLGSL